MHDTVDMVDYDMSLENFSDENVVQDEHKMMDELLDVLEKAYDEDELREPPAVIVAKKLREHLIDKHGFSNSQANRFILATTIAIWDQSTDVQIKKSISVSKKVLNRYLNRFKEIGCTPEDLCVGASNFSIVIIPGLTQEDNFS